MYFADRKEAGQKLAHALNSYRDKVDTIILALPRGGVPVAYEIAKQLRLPLDLMLVRKLGFPENEELAMGAIAIGNVMVLNNDITRSFQISPKIIDRAIGYEKAELMRRNNIYRDGRPAPYVKGKTVILVDDGMATGANMRAAVQAVRKQESTYVIIAIPVSSLAAFKILNVMVNDIVCLDISDLFYGVGYFYRNFSQTGDEEVKRLLRDAQSLLCATGEKINEPQSAYSRG